jgi:pimeloyl-ACP methyl ester carboxylesterase
LHGYGECTRSFEPLRRELGEGWALDAFDLPGFGAAPLVGSGVRAQSYIDDAADLCLRRIAGGPTPCLLVGRSLGAAIALLAALADAERAGGARAIAGLALLAPATLMTRRPPFARVPTGVWTALELAARLGLRRLIAARAAREALQRVLPRGARFDPARVEAFAVGLARPGAWLELGAIARAVREALEPESESHRRLQRRLSGLGQLSIPSLVIHGAQDPVVRPSEARWLAARIPGATLTVLQDVGHCPELEAPAAVAAALRALARRAGADLE